MHLAEEVNKKHGSPVLYAYSPAGLPTLLFRKSHLYQPEAKS